eukprot:340815-Alexandrium_andersonii.AAC.1
MWTEASAPGGVAARGWGVVGARPFTSWWPACMRSVGRGLWLVDLSVTVGRVRVFRAWCRP